MDFEPIGRSRMILRLPHFSRELRRTEVSRLNDLLEAYGHAVVQLEEYQQILPPDPNLLEDFEEACRRIEQEAEIMLGSIMAWPASR
ncbi:hypothetical protein D3C87_1951070 [compost metagenome]